MERDLETGRPVMGYLILGNLDGVLHGHGTQSVRVGECLAHYEQRIMRLLDIARLRYEDVRLYVFSDHGMADVRETCQVMSHIDALGLTFGKDYAAVYDSTMARFWFFNERARESITGALANIKQGRVLADEQLAAWGCDFPGRMYGQLIFLLDPGILLCPSFMGERPLAAMHGYAPDDVDSTAAFLAMQTPEQAPSRLDGLYALMQADAKRLGAC
jgi:hypothetical protein